jgi:hypothetical protein
MRAVAFTGEGKRRGEVWVEEGLRNRSWGYVRAFEWTALVDCLGER